MSRGSPGEALIGLSVFGAILVFYIFMAPSACKNDEAAQRLLTQQGYTNIQLTGYKRFACSKGDDYNSGFTAVAPNGATVKGVVCGGVWKDNTIRFE